jgi:hypothetical protein
MKNSSVYTAPTVDPSSAVYVFDGTMASSHVLRRGDLSVYATATYQGTVLSADALNLFSSGNVILQHVSTTTQGSSPQALLMAGQGVSGVYQPLGGANAATPSTWSSGEICSQSMVVVGVVGAVVIQEVMEAHCESGWESSCDGSCAASVGSMVQLVDPVALVGG